MKLPKPNLKLKKPGRPGKKTKRLIIFAVVLAVLAGAVYFLIKVLNTPATGTITKSSAASSTGEPTVTMATLQGKHFAVRYSSDFNDVKNVSDLSPSSVEQYRLGARSGGTTNIAINITKAPAGGVTEDSAYKFRKLRTTEYTENARLYGSTKAVVMSKMDESEATAFVLKAPYLATVAVTSSNPNRPVETILKDILTSFQWTD